MEVKVDTYNFPWQKSPTELVRHAIEHAKNKDSDFDKQMAYLVLDVGVEMIFKVFLANKAYGILQNLKKGDGKEKKAANEEPNIESSKEGNKGERGLNFHQLVEGVKKGAGDKLQGVNIDDADYFHNLRNKLYHEGDGVIPSSENLQRYLELAKKLLQILLNVDVNKSNIEETIETITTEAGSLLTVGDMLYEIHGRLDHLRFCSSLIAEQLRPEWTTHKFEIELKYIGNNNPSWSEDPRTFIAYQEKRLQLFNELTSEQFTDHELVDALIHDPGVLHVQVAFQGFGDNWREEWEYYYANFVGDNMSKFLDRRDIVKAYEKYKECRSWLIRIQEKIIDKWLDTHMPGSHIPKPDILDIDYFEKI
jgi:hypothetical protein